MMDQLIEQLANLEHHQWAHWTRHMLDNMTDENIARWRRQIDTPYSQLSEDEKNSDREWAIKSLYEIAAYLNDVMGHKLNEGFVRLK
jgi:hypothetical protein